MLCGCDKSSIDSSGCFNRGELDFIFCNKCQLVFRKKLPSDLELKSIYTNSYSNEKVESEDTVQESDDYVNKIYSKYIFNKFIKNTKQEKLLDFGSGTGKFVEELLHYKVDANGLEFSSSARSYCMENRGFGLLSPDNSIKKNSFSIITMFEVIEHIKDLKKTLDEVYRILAPSGLFIITTPNRNSFKAKMMNGEWKEAKKKFHLSLFNEFSLNYHLAQSGFTNIERVKFNPILKSGFKYLIVNRCLQIINMGGTLFIICRKN